MQYLESYAVSTLSTLIADAQRPCIVVHTHPDGDALGSGIALQRYLRERCGKHAALLIPDEAPLTLGFLTGGEDITDAAAAPGSAARAVADADLIFVLDLNDFRRTEGICTLLRESKAPKVLIDHHLGLDPAPFRLCFSDTAASSTCEILFFTLKALERGNIARLPSRTLYALMTGLTTDTNNFANSVGPNTLSMAGELLAAGVDREEILDNIYHHDRMQRLKACADLLANHLTILRGGISYMILTREMQEGYGLLAGETEGFVNMPLSVDEIKMSIFLREEEGMFRVSIRSKRGWSAARMASEWFGGGGHECAAGGKLRWSTDIPSREDAISYIEKVAARFMPCQHPSDDEDEQN